MRETIPDPCTLIGSDIEKVMGMFVFSFFPFFFSPHPSILCLCTSRRAYTLTGTNTEKVMCMCEASFSSPFSFLPYSFLLSALSSFLPFLLPSSPAFLLLCFLSLQWSQTGFTGIHI